MSWSPIEHCGVGFLQYFGLGREKLNLKHELKVNALLDLAGSSR